MTFLVWCINVNVMDIKMTGEANTQCKHTMHLKVLSKLVFAQSSVRVHNRPRDVNPHFLILGEKTC